MNYIKSTKEDWINNKEKFEELLKNKEVPYQIEFTCDCIIPSFGEYRYNKENSGVIIKIL